MLLKKFALVVGAVLLTCTAGALSASGSRPSLPNMDTDPPKQVGQPLCVQGGCYVTYCNSYGCDLVFEASDPFDRDFRQQQ